MRGLFMIDRDLLNHPVVGMSKPHNLAAWLWLVANARWKDTAADVNGKTVMLKRGQLSYSYRFLASAWKWNESKVRRYLNRLKTDAMIDAATDAGQVVITICNYDKYQSLEKYSDARSDAASDAGPTQDRRRTDAGPTQIRIPEVIPEVIREEGNPPEKDLDACGKVVRADPKPTDPKQLTRKKVFLAMKPICYGPENTDALLSAWEAKGVPLQVIMDATIDALNGQGEKQLKADIAKWHADQNIAAMREAAPQSQAKQSINVHSMADAERLDLAKRVIDGEVKVSGIAFTQLKARGLVVGELASPSAGPHFRNIGG